MASGKWTIKIRAMGQEKDGKLDFDTMEGEAMGMELPIVDLVEEGDIAKFSLMRDGQAIKFKIKFDGDTYLGKAKFGPMKMEASGEKIG